MIVYPSNWASFSGSVSLGDIERAIIKTMAEIDCHCLSFSGGLDSTLMLYYMKQIHERVEAFTIGLSENHPDVISSRMIARQSGIRHHVYIPSAEERAEVTKEGDLPGDGAVRLFYRWAQYFTDRMIACDGIDELMCGYFSHQADPGERTFHESIDQLVPLHLIPLDHNSGTVQVYLPYLAEDIANLLFRIPSWDKVDGRQRKKLMLRLAEGKVPQAVLERRKYGFCDALLMKEESNDEALIPCSV